MTFKEAYDSNADFMDGNTGLIYKIQEYKRIKNLGLPNINGGLRVVDPMTGEEVGIVEEETLKDYI